MRGRLLLSAWAAGWLASAAAQEAAPLPGASGDLDAASSSTRIQARVRIVRLAMDEPPKPPRAPSLSGEESERDILRVIAAIRREEAMRFDLGGEGECSAAEMADRLFRRYRYEQRFARSKGSDISLEDFLRRVAARSPVGGAPYAAIDPDGRRRPMSEFLRETLTRAAQPSAFATGEETTNAP